MPNLIDPCSLLTAAVDALKKSGGKDRGAFQRELEGSFGKGLSDDAVADLHDAAKQYAAREARAAKRLSDAEAKRAGQMAGLQRSSVWEVIGAARRFGLLNNVRTLRRYVESHELQALRREGLRPADAFFDALLSLKSGRRTTEGGWFGTGGRVAERTKSVVSDLRDDLQAIREHGVAADELGMLDAHRKINTGGNNIVSKAFDAYVDWSGRAHNALTRTWVQRAYHRSIEESANLMARAEGRAAAAGGKAFDVRGRASELIQNPTEAMEAQALIEGQVATFNTPNAMATWLGKAPDPMLQAGIDLLVPFRKIPANIAGDIATANPVGMVYNAFKFGRQMVDTTLTDAARLAAQKRLSTLLTNGVTGSALIGYGWQLAEAGILSPPSAGDKAQRDTNEALGVRPASILIGGQRRSLTGLHPLLNVLALGAAIHANGLAALTKEERQKALAERKGLPFVAQEGMSEDLHNLGFDLADLLEEQPFLKGAKNLTDAVKDERGAGRFVAEAAASYVPTGVADLGGLFGDNRVQRAPEGALQGVQNRIPWLRTSLPPKIDALGQPLAAATGLDVADLYSTRPDPRNATDPLKRWIIDNGVKISKSTRDQGESAEDYAHRLVYVGHEVKAALDDMAQQYPHPDAQDKEVIALRIKAAKTRANAQYKVDRRAHVALADLPSMPIGAGGDADEN